MTRVGLITSDAPGFLDARGGAEGKVATVRHSLGGDFLADAFDEWPTQPFPLVGDDRRPLDGEHE